VGPHPAVAAMRLAVRRSFAGELSSDDAACDAAPGDLALRDAATDDVAPGDLASGELSAGDLVLVACSGGADSLALAAAVAFEAPRAGLRAGGVVVDHGLQPGSAEVAASVVETMASLGLDPALEVSVRVAGPGDPNGYQGPEAAARSARYAALDQTAASAGAAAVVLGHTLDDQAETVLLGLARGAGARSLAGMPGRSGRYLRPLLGLRRAQTRAACAALGLEPWDDPQNRDPAFTRVRVRHELLPALEAALGPGVAEALARTARLLRADADALDELAVAAAARIQAVGSDPDDWPPSGSNSVGLPSGAVPDGWSVRELAAQPAAVRHRILRLAALAAGCPGGALSERHIASLDELVTSWRGQRWTDLPGGVRCQRRYGRLLFTAGAPGVAPRDHTAGAPVAGVGPGDGRTARSEEPGGRD
jgi:tRNA(Ile)-lysidine synthase